MNATADLAEAEWDAVIKARVEEIDAGTAKLIPLEEVEAEMDVFVASLASSQPSRPSVVTHAQVVRQFKAASETGTGGAYGALLRFAEGHGLVSSEE